MNTGNQQPGYASMGAWISYGLGSENENLPTFIAMVSQGSGKNPGQPIFSRLWGSGFLPSSHQGVGLRPGANPVLYLADPPGDRSRAAAGAARRPGGAQPAAGERARRSGDARSHPRLRNGVSHADLGAGADRHSATNRPRRSTPTAPRCASPGSYAANCLLARRLIERDVRFVQLFHRGWDQHIAIARQLPNQCRDVDQPTAALIKDLQAARPARRHAGDVRHGVRPHGVQPGRAGRPGHGPRPSRPLLHRVAGRRRRASRAWSTARPTTSATTSSRTRSTCATCTRRCCIAWGSTTSGSRYKFRGLDVRLTGVEEAHVVKAILA